MSLLRKVLEKAKKSPTGTGEDNQARSPSRTLRRQTAATVPHLTVEQVNAISQLVNSRPHWYQSWQICDDIRLPGHVHVEERLDVFGVPADLKGLRIMDVGTCNGAFAFEFERRGAEVVAVDICSPDHYGFETLSKILRSSVQFVQMPVYDLDGRFPAESFDFVLFSGVFYHLRHPLLALDKLHVITKQGVWVESHVIDDHLMVDGAQTVLPKKLRSANLMQFYRHDELANDPSNFFGPSVSCLEAMLWSSGFKPELKLVEGGRACFFAGKIPGTPEYERILSGKHPAYHYTEGTK